MIKLEKRIGAMVAAMAIVLAMLIGLAASSGMQPVRAAGWQEQLLKLNAYMKMTAIFEKYNKPQNVIKGDILIKEADGSYDTESNAVYPVAADGTYTLGLKLDVSGIKKNLESIKQEISNDTAVKTYLNYMGNGGLDVVGIKNLKSQLVAEVTIPDGIDVSGKELANSLKNLQLRDNFGSAAVNKNASVHIDNTDVKDYDLSGYVFKVSKAELSGDQKKITITMDLQTPKNYKGQSYGDVSQFNFGCLYAVVTGMPDIYTLEIPGVKVNDNKAIKQMTIKGSMGSQTTESSCYMSCGLSYSAGVPVRMNWYATQLDGGKDAVNANGISLTVARQAKLAYNANGGSGNMETIKGLMGKGLQVAANGFKRDGYRFTGWNTKADGSGTDYRPGNSLTLNEDTVLFAQWKKVRSNAGTTRKPITKRLADQRPGTGDASEIPFYTGLGISSLAVLALIIAANKRRCTK